MNRSDGWIIAAIAIVGLSGCGEANHGSVVPRASAPVASSSTSSAPPVASVVLPPDVPLARAPFDAASITLTLDDPRLADAKALAPKKPLEAARTIEKLLEAAAKPSAAGTDPLPVALDEETTTRWWYEIAALRDRAGDAKSAARAYDKAAVAKTPLQPFARAFAAASLLSANDGAGALTRIQATQPGELPLGYRDQLLARASLRAGKIEEALEVYRRIVARHESGWVDTSLELARALLDHPSPEHAIEAAKVALDVELDAPGAREAEGKKLHDAAASNMSKASRDALDFPAVDERADRIERLVTANRSKQALVLAEKLAKEPESCATQRARARALSGVGRHSEASDAFERALLLCESTQGVDFAKLLFDAGKAAAQGGDLDRAMNRYERLEDSFASHSLADDARVEAARAALKKGDFARFSTLLAPIAGDYPAGDTTGDGVFLLALEHMKRDDWTLAVPILEKGKTLARERSYQRAGRFRYFLGRALIEIQRPEEAREELAATLAEYPLAYYSALAYARLEELTTGGGKVALDAARALPRSQGIAAPDDAITSSPAFKAALELTRADDPRGLMVALDLLGVTDRSASEDVVVAGALMLGRTRDPVAAYAILRTAGEREPRAKRNEAYSFREAYPTGSWRAIWEAAYPRPFQTETARASTESSIPDLLLYAIMREESAFQPRVISKAGAIGLTQVMPFTAKSAAKRLGVKDDAESVKDPETNLRLGAHYLRKMRERFSDDVLLAIPAYNAGPGAPEKWTKKRPDYAFDLFVEDIPYAETRGYTKRVLASLAAYEILYGETVGEAHRTPRSVRRSGASP